MAFYRLYDPDREGCDEGAASEVAIEIGAGVNGSEKT